MNDSGKEKSALIVISAIQLYCCFQAKIFQGHFFGSHSSCKADALVVTKLHNGFFHLRQYLLLCTIGSSHKTVEPC